MEQLTAPIVFNRHLTGDYWLLEVECPSMASALKPGQFVNIRIGDNLTPYLRRPFSVYRISEDRRRLQVAYKVIGEGTRLMKETLHAGGLCDLIGPLGQGFSLPEHAKRIAVVGRGIGIAALPTLVDEAARRGVQVYAYLSARTRDNLVAEDIFAEYGFAVHTHTDEENSQAKVTDPLVALSQELDFDAFYVCGSNRLAKAINEVASRQGVPAEIAMEQHMACGFGDCHGCVIPVTIERGKPETALREVCHYGPVFNTWEVIHA
ncbi:dihydroorotate dehydrogenase electron transfer subunit [Pusillimonas sp. CC-YST705]|uniref:Dihydroorotate dehydrogenase electron transfer subunit n=1 Tax=Mesopusillimonas faecipullorum TaxID=2755040 RepID=A0ABS8CAE4_9BURK|nr:dihydroorotate dehydrogenase electron transfer subunit [Mesopusillimonas faecipullorum]MCB5363006.1 dihydroorotate dehydrogenase electron transfer subunit [Mesopusillimonas faecipullorum]